jgi:hypothetical protein
MEAPPASLTRSPVRRRPTRPGRLHRAPLRWAIAVAWLAAATAGLAACGSTAPAPVVSTTVPTTGGVPVASPAPTGGVRASATPPSATPGVSWSKATVERPAVIVSAPMPSAYIHPGHFEGQAYMAGVAWTPAGFVAVGYEWPGWHALSWRSPDGRSWTLSDPGEGEGTFMTAVASGPSGIVAVGRDSDDAAAWVSADGGTWRRVASPAFVDPAHLRMTAVAAVAGGFLAGGAAGPDIGRQEARLWSSADGRTWASVPLPDAVDARVTGIATGSGTIVAVGTRGTEREPAGSIAWTSSDGRSWRRVPPTSDLAAGLMASVAPDGPGFVAVGADGEQRAAVVWRSPDGIRWERVDSPTFIYHDQKIRMTAIAAGPAGLVAVGNYVPGIQFGVARAWTASPTGDDWTVVPEVPSFQQGEMLAVAANAERVVAVGTFGAPDNYVPTAWLSPPLP